MKYLVFSDTHNDIHAVKDILDKHPEADKILHLGDYYKDGKEIAKLAGKEVIGVKGNMDGGYKDQEIEILDTEAGPILLTHGHMESVKFDLRNLYYLTLEKGCKAALFGHTHIPCIDENQGISFFNPGSLSLPAGGRKGSYGLLTADEAGFTFTVFYLDDSQMKKKPAAKPAGGNLRDMLNNSDRA